MLRNKDVALPRILMHRSTRMPHPRSFPQPGDAFTVFQSKPDFGPSMRFVANLADWDDSSMLLTLGESGVWTDVHYADMERDWVNVSWSATPFTDNAVLSATRDLLTLQPARP